MKNKYEINYTNVSMFMKAGPCFINNFVNLLKDNEPVYTKVGSKGNPYDPYREYKLRPNNDGQTFSVYLMLHS